ncbi:MAG: cohesin domain-containing protein [Candidatus Azambacteria bacterium]|nr:cohesin domain-containing protein [Candidatus Azambacteria bacterium]
MKKYLLIAGIIMGGAALPAVAFGATLSMSPTTGTYQVGDIITTQIILNTQGASIEGVDVRYLNYNPALLEVQDKNPFTAGVQITPGTLMPNTVANSVDASLGRITFSQVISGNNTFTGSGVLATVQFRVLGQGSTSVSFNFTPGNTADTNIASAGADILTLASHGTYTLTAIPVVSLAPRLYITPASGTKATGESSFLFHIMLDTRGSAIDGADVVLTYNRSLAQVIDADGGADGIQITPGTLMPNTVANSVNASYGRIEFSQITTANTSFNGSGVLATVRVQALAPGVANFAFLFTKGRTNDTNVSFGGVDLLNEVVNASFQFVENAIPPVVMSVEPVGVVMFSNSLTIKAVTNEASTCRYSLTPNVDYAAMRKYFSSRDGMEHSASLYRGSFSTGQNTFYVRCSDRSRNTMTSDVVISFFIVTDTTPPVITQASPSGVFFMPRSVSISVVSQDESGVAACKFSPTPNTDYTMMRQSLYLRDGVFSTFVYGSNLRIGTNYFYVRCADKVGNANTSDTVISFVLVATPTFTVGVEGGFADRYTFSIALSAPNGTSEILNIKTRPNRFGAIAIDTDPRRGDALLAPGNYDIKITSDQYLKRKLVNMSVTGGAVISVSPLLAGDLNDDGVINSLDWSIMDTQWAKRSSADINKDGKVNTIDWGYIRKNWLQTGM